VAGQSIVQAPSSESSLAVAMKKNPQVGVLLPTPEPAPVPHITACSQALALTPELPSAHAGVPLSYESHVAMLL